MSSVLDIRQQVYYLCGMTLSEQVRAILDRNNWTAYRLAKVSGVDQAVISRILSGERKNPSYETMQKILKAKAQKA